MAEPTIMATLELVSGPSAEGYITLRPRVVVALSPGHNLPLRTADLSFTLPPLSPEDIALRTKAHWKERRADAIRTLARVNILGADWGSFPASAVAEGGPLSLDARGSCPMCIVLRDDVDEMLAALC